MRARRREDANESATVQAERMIVDALRSGQLEPATVLEMVHYAGEPDLVEAFRAIAALPAADRAKAAAFALGLAARRDAFVTH